MKNENDHLEALQDIRKMMKDSSKFLSLSGLSGVFAGIYALIGAYLGHMVLKQFENDYMRESSTYQSTYNVLVSQILLICLAVLFFSIITAFYFTSSKAKKNQQKLFDHTSKKLLWNLLFPLSSGGVFCLALVYHGHGLVMLVSPVMLLFYGLALVSCARFTMHDIAYLGYFQVLLGLIAAFFPGHGLLFWTLGFGVLHIIYGSIMWYKYDRH